METKYGFIKMTLPEFKRWIKEQNVARHILYIQEHHTWVPSYIHFTGNNHFERQLAMKNSHRDRGFSNIAQHFTIFPDGTILTGRSLEDNPAGIAGKNSNAICIENLGDFDTGKDTMTTEQKRSIIEVTAALCKRFNIPVNTDRILYHTWFASKSCPGTNFFGGNTKRHCEQNLLPLILQVYSLNEDGNHLTDKFEYGIVTADTLNVRTGTNTSYSIAYTTSYGSVIRIWEKKDGWYKISKSKEEWVYARYVDIIKAAVVNADILNVRSGPSANYTKLDKVVKGDMVFIFEEQNDWAKIAVDEKWVSMKYLDLK